MAEPVTKKIDTLPAMEEPVATNDKLLILDVSAPATTMTKLITMNQVRISSAAQLDANVVENAKIKDGAVSTPKLDQTAGSQAVATGTIRDNAVTFAKVQDVDGYSVVGRSGSTAGDADEITAGENTVLGRVGTGNVAFNKLATTQLANTNARTVIGNATNASATPSTIASNTDGYVLRQNGDTLGFGTLTNKSLAAGAVTAGKIAAGGVSASSQFAAEVVDTNALKNANVTTAKIGNLQVTSDKLAAGAVTAWKIANDGINNQYQFAAGVVTNRCLDGTPGSEAVTTDKIANAAITNDKLATGAVTAGKIASGAVTAGKIASGGISASSQFAAQVVDTAAIKDANVTNDKIANATITDAKLASIDKTLLVRLLANDEVTALRTWTNEFLWPPSLNGLVIKEAYATLSVASSSGSVVVAVKNAGNTVTTLTVSQGSLYSPAGSINTSYRTVTQFQGCSFQITSAGTGAKGLSIILVVGRA